MKRKMLLRLAAVPFLAAMGALPSVSGCGVIADAACPDFNASASYGANLEIDADVKTFMQAAGNFQVLGEQMAKDVGDACVKIATVAGGDTTKWAGTEGADYVKAACKEADASLAKALAGATIEFYVAPGVCQVDLKVTADCNASCDVSGKCTPAQLEAKCEPGKLAGSCSGECNGSCSATAGSIDCAARCDARCTGTCSGTCVGRCDNNDTGSAGTSCAGTCDGSCSETCTGKCSGACEVTDPKVACQGTCHGECSVEFQAPHCEGKLTPPECDIDAECRANCEASATAKAECTAPSITYSLASPSGADLTAIAAVIEETLPVLVVNSIERGQGLVDSANALVTSGNTIAGKADLAADAAACATVAAGAALVAAANIEASVSFSVQVSATATVSSN